MVGDIEEVNAIFHNGIDGERKHAFGAQGDAAPAGLVARELLPVENEHARTGSSQLPGGGAAGRPGADNGDIKAIHAEKCRRRERSGRVGRADGKLRGMLFETRFREPIASGQVTLTFRRWKRPQAVAGRRYRTAVGMLEVEAVDIVEAGDITDAEAERAGYASVAGLISDFRGTDDVPIYRVRFHPVTETDPRNVLAASADLSDDDRAEIARRLGRLDRAAAGGPWTMAVLRAIESNPGLRSVELSAPFGRELLAFKTDVRKLKNLGLTISLGTGYRLSPRGEAYVRGLPTAD